MNLLRGLDRRLIISFLLLVVAIILVGNLASEVVEGDTLAFDRWLIESLRDVNDRASPLGPAWIRKTMVDLTSLGGGPFLTLLTLAVAGYLLAARKTATAIFVIAAIASGALVSNLLKMIFVRPRPDIVPHLVPVDSPSFPSAHAMNSALTFLTIGVLLASTHKERRLRVYLLGTAVLLTLLVGASRVYLGVHWPTDVAAGWVVGAAWAIGCSLVMRALQLRHRVESPD